MSGTNGDSSFPFHSPNAGATLPVPVLAERDVGDGLGSLNAMCDSDFHRVKVLTRARNTATYLDSSFFGRWLRWLRWLRW